MKFLAVIIAALGCVASASAQNPLVLTLPYTAATCQQFPAQSQCVPHIQVEVFNIPAQYRGVLIEISYMDSSGVERRTSAFEFRDQYGNATWGVLTPSDFTDAKGTADVVIIGPRL